jgi:hypothetical protein
MKKLLLEGGVGGHLNHLYDNRQMTYNKMVSILKKASSGQLVGTEKADGYNIFLGYQGGVARAARNKTDMQRGGMTMEELVAREFKGGEKVRQAYIQSFDAYQAALGSLSDQEKVAIFGPNGEVFYNTEIMGPAAAQLLNYDVNVLSIHHGGHKTYNRETDTVEVVDATENSKILDKVIDRFESATADKPFAVQRTAYIKLEALDSDASLNVTISKLQKAGFSGTMTIEDYLEMKIKPVIENTLPYYDPTIKQDIIDRILNKEGKRGVAQITKGFPKDQKTLIGNLVKQSGKLLKDAIWPIEEAIHEFAVDMLEGMESAYILNNEKELQRLQAEVGAAIKQIAEYTGPGEEQAKDILLQQLQKLKHHNKVNATIEGFVFEEDGMLYKFTGNYAPMNQLLGMFKYGRGKIPAIGGAKEETKDLQEHEGEDDLPQTPMATNATPVPIDNEILDSVALFPGGFKPPHKGHFEAAVYLSNIRGVDQVYVIISPKPRAEHGFNSRAEVTAEMSKELWDLYIAVNSHKIGAPIIATIGTGITPVSDAYDFMMKMNPGQTVTFAKGSKDQEDKRFDGAQSWSDKKGLGLNVKLINTPVFGGGISGTKMRELILEKDWKNFADNLPLTNMEHIQHAWAIVTGAAPLMPQAQPALQEVLFRMVEQTLNEVETEKQRRWACAQMGDDFKGERKLTKKQAKEMCKSEVEESVAIDEMSAMGAGAVAGGMMTGDGSGPFPGIDIQDENDKEKQKSKQKTNPVMLRKSGLVEDTTIDEVLDYLLQNIGSAKDANR